MSEQVNHKVVVGLEQLPKGFAIATSPTLPSINRTVSNLSLSRREPGDCP